MSKSQDVMRKGESRMKKIRRRCQSTPRAKKNLTHTLRVPLVTFTPDDVDVLLSMIDLLALIGKDSRAGADLPLMREIEQRTRETQQKLVSIKDHQGEMMAFDYNDYMVIYTAVMLFGQVKQLMPVLLPACLAAPHVAARLEALEKMFASVLPSVRVDEMRRG